MRHRHKYAACAHSDKYSSCADRDRYPAAADRDSDEHCRSAHGDGYDIHEPVNGAQF